MCLRVCGYIYIRICVCISEGTLYGCPTRRQHTGECRDIYIYVRVGIKIRRTKRTCGRTCGSLASMHVVSAARSTTFRANWQDTTIELHVIEAHDKYITTAGNLISYFTLTAPPPPAPSYRIHCSLELALSVFLFACPFVFTFFEPHRVTAFIWQRKIAAPFFLAIQETKARRFARIKLKVYSRKKTSVGKNTKDYRIFLTIFKKFSTSPFTVMQSCNVSIHTFLSVVFCRLKCEPSLSETTIDAIHCGNYLSVYLYEHSSSHLNSEYVIET